MRLSTAIIVAALLLSPRARVALAEDDAKPKDPAAKRDAADKAAEPARKALEKPLPAAGFDNLQLGEVVDFLRNVSGATIWLDRPSLKKVEIDPAKTVITMKVEKGQALKDALAGLTKQMVGTKEENAVADACGSVIVISTEAGAKAFVERHRKALARGGNDAPSLGRELPEVTFADVPFQDVIDFLRDVTGATIDVDWKALGAAGVVKNKPVNVRARGIKFSQALRLILDDAAGDKPLDFAAKGDRVIITDASSIKEAEKKLEKAEGL
jgi:hypothetical protein